MASITQTIDNYTGGISQQPDEKKLPGQVVEAKNVLPDIVEGLLKRPGSRLIGSLSDGTNNSQTNGKWFHYYRDEAEQYIGQISRTGDINVWRCSDGQEMTVNYDGGTSAALTSYLTHTNDEDIQTLTLNDYTYFTNRTKTTAMAATIDSYAPAKPKEAYIELKKIAYASQYGFNVFDDNSLQTTTTATRLSIASTDLGTNSYCPNVGTKIYNVTGDRPAVHRIYGITSSVDHANDFMDTNSTAMRYYLIHNGNVTAYDNTASYSTGAFVYTADSDGTNRIYKATGSIGSGGGAPTHKTGTTSSWEAKELWTAQVTVYWNDTYSGNQDISRLIEGWKGHGNYSSLPFTLHPKDSSTTEFYLVYKDTSTGPRSLTTKLYSTTQADTSTTLVTISNTVTGDGNIASYTTGTTGSTADQLYFRLTTTGQAVPEGGTANPEYQCRYTSVIDLLNGGRNWSVGDTVAVMLEDGFYTIKVEETSESRIQANLGLIRPTPTSFDAKTTVTSDAILGSLRTELIAADDDADDWVTWDETAQYGIKQIGNGLYIKRKDQTATFGISSPVGDLLNVLTDSVADVADLPTQCRDGYVIKVRNSDAEQDDYFVKFESDETGKDGNGSWTECPEPSRKIAFDPATMPIQMIREADGTFTVKQITWEDCLVGSTVTVPEPSFIGKTINQMLFWRNRLILLSDENVNMSQPGHFYNFWPKSAITYTASDNIVISCSSEFPAIIQDGVQTNSGLVLLTKTQQFLLSTDSDILSPVTAKINTLSTYNFNASSNPISLGTSIGFLDNAGKFSRFWEMFNILREGEPIVIDQTKVVSKLFDKDINKISNSRENGIVFFCKKDSSTLYGLRYFNTGERRVQQSWFTWELTGTIQHHAVLDDSLYVILRNHGKDTMQKIGIKIDTDSVTSVDDKNNVDATDDVTYRVHLDTTSTISSGTYDATTDITTFTKPNGYESTAQLNVYDNNTSSDNIGEVGVVTVDSTNLKVPGDWSSRTVVLGYLYDMQIQLPTIYKLTQKEQSSIADTHSSLVVHRVKMNFGGSGLYTTTIDRKGKPSYTETWDPPLADDYSANTSIIEDLITQTIPTYEKNKNITVTIKSTAPTPATLYSMSWEGDYTPKYYQRV